MKTTLYILNSLKAVYYKSTLSLKAKITTTLILLVLLSMTPLIYILAFPYDIKPNLDWYWVVLLYGFIIFLPLFFYLHSPKSLSLENSTLTVHFPFRIKKIETKDILQAEHLKVRLVFLSESKGLFGYIGRLNGDKCFIKDESKIIKISLKKGSLYYSCDAPEKLVEELST